MSITNYSELKTAVINWLDRTDLEDRVPEFIALGETRIGRRLRVRGQVGRSTTVLVPGQAYYALPSGFLEARNVQVNSDPVVPLSYRTPEQLDVEYPRQATSGVSKVFTIIGDEIQLAPAPESANNMEVSFYQRLSGLTDTNTTNWLTTNAPDLLLYGALIEAEAYLVNDQRIPLWKAAFDESMTEWNDLEKKARHSGSVLIQRIDGLTP